MKKEKYTVEYSLNKISPASLWTYIGTANGLSEWFAHPIVTDGKHFTFYWNDTPQEAMQIALRTGTYIRFKWCDEEPDSKTYFEFRIHVTELTGDVGLEITDFAFPDEKEESIDLWNKQVETLRRQIGA
ncbi:MAG: hypothetical protein J1E02_06760 [Coprobacter sp.]|nr:hypothetical protein [Coprobacter sp.]